MLQVLDHFALLVGSLEAKVGTASTERTLIMPRVVESERLSESRFFAL